MIDRETLKESQVCLIGYLLENIKDIDTLSITKEYLKDFTVQGEKYNFKYIFERIEQIHKENRDNELLLELVNDELIGKDKLVQLVNGNTFEKLASIKEMERIIIQAHKEDLLEEAYTKLKNGECDINKYAETVKQINQLGTVKQENVTEEDLKPFSLHLFQKH